MENNQNNEKTYSLLEFYYVSIKHYKIILFSFLLTILSVIYFTLISKPIYQSSSTIMINEEKSSMDMLDLSFNNNRNYIENEINILTSRTTSELAIKKLLDSGFKNKLYLFETKKYKPVYYRTILTLGILDKLQDNVVNLKNDLDSQSIENFGNRLLSNIAVSNQRNTDILTISVKSLDPDEAALLTNVLVDVYRTRDLEYLTGEMTHLKSFLLEQLKEKEKELKKYEEKLKNFQEREKIFTLDKNSNLLLDNLTMIESDYSKTLAEINIAESREDYINTTLTSDEQNIIEKVVDNIDIRLFALQEEIALTESDLITSINKYGSNHSVVLQLEESLIRLKNKLKIETKIFINEDIYPANPILYRQSLMDSMIYVQSNKSYLQAKANAYENLISEYSEKISKLPEKILEFTRLERNRSILAETYSFMRKKLEEARIGEASKIGKIRVIDKAVPIHKPVHPNKKINIFLGIILGIGAGFSIAFIIEYLDNTIKTVEQIERRGLNVLTIIPSIGHFTKRKSKKYFKNNKDIEKIKRRLITHENPKSPISESYRNLRTALMYSNVDNQKIILVSSSGPGEGKTTTIANLAITYANLGKKTLLIDSDLRKPVVHKIFKLDKSPGLTSFLSSNDDNISKIINKTDINNLDVVTSGVVPPNPSELLDSEKMNDFIKLISNEYDMILFDSPPLLAVTDAFVLMKYVNQFILVVRSGITERGGLDRVLNSLNQANHKINGVVMNDMKQEHSYGAGYYYNYYQYYYGDNTED